MGAIVGFMFIFIAMVCLLPIYWVISKTKWFNKFLDDLMDRRI